MFSNFVSYLFQTHRCAQEALLIYEGQQCNALPGKAFAVHVHLEVFRIEVEDRGVWVGEEALVGLGQGFPGCSWEHTHELVEGLERVTQSELDVHLGQALQIGGKGGVVVGVVPRPGCHTCHIHLIKDRTKKDMYSKSSDACNQTEIVKYIIWSFVHHGRCLPS